MSDAAPHPTPRAGGPGVLLMQLLAGLLVLLGGLCAGAIIPFTLMITVMDPGSLAPGIAHWMMYLWCLLAFMGSIGVIIAGVGAFDVPRPGRILILFAIAATIFLAFPPFWTMPA